MTKSEHPKLIIRMKPDVKSWLAAQSEITGRSMTDEINALVKKAMKERPIFATVRRVMAFGDEFYCATIGDAFDADAFFEGSTKEEAIKAARTKLEELGFPRARIEFVEEKIG